MKSPKIARLVVGLCVLLLPTLVWAQAETGTIAGAVRDASGGVVPGVTVEAASPALIEKVRVVVTDGQGLYRIVDLRPGPYTVTFTLPGFSTFRRDGIELTTGFTATVNAELKVGTVEETITVSGESPMVDIQNVQQQVTIPRATLDALPTTRRPAQIVTLIPGANAGSTAFHDVGGVGIDRGEFGIHGQRTGDMTYNFSGMDSRQASGGSFPYNVHTFQEIVVETAAGTAEATTGGIQINIVPKDGGNTFSGSASVEYTGPSLQTDNVTDELRARGLTAAPGVRKYIDWGGGLGGPIKRDKLWFFAAHRELSRGLYQAGNYFNKRQGTLFYEPDLSRPAYTNDYSKDFTLRLTGQIAAKHKIVVAHTQNPSCQCRYGLLEATSSSPFTVLAPEAVGAHHYNPQYLSLFTYTYPATNRLLIEVDAARNAYHRNQKRQADVTPDTIPVIDQGLNLTYGARLTGYQVQPDDRDHERFSVAYVTGSNSFKVGLDMNQFSVGRESYSDANLYQATKSYTFRNQVPVSVTIYAAPFGTWDKATENSVYVQDQWTLRRLTLNLGVRYSVYDATVQEMHLPAGPWVPARDFPEVKHSPNWKNLSPRVGSAYDVFGNGKTALKWSLGRYPSRNEGLTVNSPAGNQAVSVTRTWADANRNFVPECDLGNPAANGECAGWNDVTFGQIRAGNTRRADDAIQGFNRQNYNWQSSISIQQELRQGLALNVGYFRTWHGGFLAVDNQLVTPDDFDQYCITAPTDPRLPASVSGQRFCGLYDIKPTKFAQVDNLITQSSHYGNQSEVFNGVDITLNARFGQGGQIQGGLATGRTVTDNCFVVDNPATVVAGLPGRTLTIPTVDTRPDFCKTTPPLSAATQVKFSVVYPLPWGFQTSAIYQNTAGFPLTATYVASNAEIRPSLGRNLASCPSQTAATCSSNAPAIDLIPPNTLFEDRIQQLDLRFTRAFPVGKSKLRGNFDVYNIFNAATILNENTRYSLPNGGSWQQPLQVMGGRVLKVSALFDF